MTEQTTSKAFEAWSSKISTEGHPTAKGTEAKVQPWKDHVKAEMRNGPTKGKALVTRSYDEDLSESNLGQ
jgi:hypothetical protein